MSQEPRPSPPSSQSPDGPRHRQRRRSRQRGPRPSGESQARPAERRDQRPRPQPSQSKKPREDRRPRREDRPRRQSPPPAKTTLGQKLVWLLTFGLVKPGAKPATRHDSNTRPPRPAKALPHVEPVDLETITTNRLFVGNLHYRATENDLRDLFGGIGKVASTDIVYSSRTYQSKGCGFVQMMSVIDARRAVEELHGKLFMGRPLLLGPAQERGSDARERDDEPPPA